MSLVTPDIGLILWQTIVFLIVFGILAVFVWSPIMSALKTREFQIEDSLRAAEHAKEEMEQIKSDNEYLLQEARYERDDMLKEAKEEATRIIDRAKAETADITSKMLQDARDGIEAEKKAAVAEVKAVIADLSIEIAEKVLKESLADNKAQKDLVNKFVEEAKIN